MGRAIWAAAAAALAILLAACGSDGGSERVEVTYDLRERAGSTVDAETLDETAAILSDRLRALGEADLSVETSGSSQIAVFGETSDVDRVAASLDDPAVLRIGNPAVPGVEIGNEEVLDPVSETDPVTDQPSVHFDLTPRGRIAFRRLTSAGGTLTITLDDQVVSEARLDPSIGPEGVDGRRGVQITGAFSLEDAELLAAFLAIGPLPVDLVVADEAA